VSKDNDQAKKREMGWVHSTYEEEEQNAYGILVGRPEGKQLLGRLFFFHRSVYTE
jgi:hypothetical protein